MQAKALSVANKKSNDCGIGIDVNRHKLCVNFNTMRCDSFLLGSLSSLKNECFVFTNKIYVTVMAQRFANKLFPVLPPSFYIFTFNRRIFRKDEILFPGTRNIK